MTEEVIKSELPDGLVALGLVKKHLRVEEDYTDDDELIDMYRSAAETAIENFIERPLRLQTTVYTSTDFKDFVFERKAINDEVESVQYWTDPETEPSELSKDHYSVSRQGTETFRVTFKDTPEEVVKVEIKIRQGYDAQTLPKDIKHALFLLVTEAYDKRDNIPNVINTKARALVLPYRKWRI